MGTQTYSVVHEHQHGTSVVIAKCNFDLYQHFANLFDAEYPEAAEDFLKNYLDIDFDSVHENITITEIKEDDYKILIMDIPDSE